MPYLIGIAGVIVIWLVYRLFSGKWNLMSLVTGGDGLPSSSQFQFLLWTIVIIFAYVTTYVARTQMGECGPIAEIPVNLLILMGISSFALVASKGITAYQLSGGTASIKQRRPEGSGFKYLIGDDEGKPTLNKLQMIAWTFIAIAIYIFMVVKQVESGAVPALPDVDESLLVLMGISQGTYLGKRLVTTTMATLQKLALTTTDSGREVTLTGLNMGDEQYGGLVKVGDFFPSEIKSWSDKEVKFVLPPSIEAGVYPVSVTIGGKESNKLTMAIE
ncbi:IPT/TIG domain-containing protein [Chloroflexota bacterium]